MGFCGLHNHTEWSNIKLRDALTRTEELVNKAIEYGYSGIALTEHEVLTGHIQALEIADKIKKDHSDFKIMLGNEIYLIDESEYKQNPRYGHFILIAKDRVGHDQIRALSSRAWDRSYNERGMLRTPTFYQDFEDIVAKDKGHLIASSACLGGSLDIAILAKNNAKINFLVPWMIEMFRAENVCLELQDSDSDDQKIVNETLVRMANFFGVRYIVTSDVHYLSKEDIHIHHSFLNSKDEKERETESFYRYTYLKPQNEIREILSYLPSETVETAMSNTMQIYDLVEPFDLRHEIIVPTRKPESFVLSHSLSQWYDKYPYIKQYAYSEEEQDRYLMYLIEQGITEKKLVIGEVEAERINTELDVLFANSEGCRQPLSAYLNLIKRVVDIIWDVSFVGISRGSALCWFINYIIGIVQVSPLKYNICYWRFFNKASIVRDENGEIKGAAIPDVDIDVCPELVPQILDKLREYYGESNVLNCLTYKSESLKSAILDAARGLGISSDEAQVLSGMVPISRGMVPTLQECIEGNEEKDMPPVPGFTDALNQYDGLLETVKKIEGIVCGRGIHASALYIFNNEYLTQNSLVRAPNKTKTTAFNMKDSDSMGAMKLDLLSTDLQTKLMKCMELMLADGRIQWQGSLRATYNKYFHPEVLDYDSPKMWEDMWYGRINSLFQFDSQVGSVCIRRTKPTNVLELGACNAVMRLQPEHGKENPLDRYVRFKENINEWYQEMEDYGLTQEEQEILKKQLGSKYGNAPEQEDVMELVQIPEISGFTLLEANTLRKGISKKKKKIITQMKERFFGPQSKGRKKLLSWVWDNCIAPQCGYAFSVPHDLAYGIEAIQQANIYTHYHPLYWNCASLSVDAGVGGADFDDFGDEEDPMDVLEPYENPEAVANGKNTDYGKIAKALGKIQSQGVTISLPDINKSRIDFYPDIPNNAIVYGLYAIVGMNPDTISAIISNRPYTSLNDFLSRVELTNLQMIGLIKSGAFDALEGKSRACIMDQYLRYNAEKRIERKKSLNMGALPKLNDFQLIPQNFQLQTKAYYFLKWVKEHCLIKGVNNKNYYQLIEEDEKKFFSTLLQDSLTNGKDYDIIPSGFLVKAASLNKAIDTYMTPLKEWMSSDTALNALYEAEVEDLIKEWEFKYCMGSQSKWEMDALSYYYSGHELAKVNNGKYNIVNFQDLPLEPQPREYQTNARTGVEYAVYDTVRIAGTVLNADKAKHIVSLLTVYGVVDVKFYKMAFINYNKQISRFNEKGKKEVVEKSWFARGNMLMVSGIRRDNMFHPRRDFAKGYKTTLQLIQGVTNGELILKSNREKEKETK